MICVFGQRNTVRFRFGGGRIEQAEFHLGGMLRKQRKIDTLAIPYRAKRIRVSWPNSHDVDLLRDNELMIDTDNDAFSAAAKPHRLGLCDLPRHIDEPHYGLGRA